MNLTDDTFLQLAMRHYTNPQCHSIEEFNEDLKSFNYLNKIFYRYNDRRQLNEMLLINRIITCFNLFGNATIPMLMYKIEKEYHVPLITTLRFLNRMPETLNGFDYTQIGNDPYLYNILSKRI